MYTTKTNWGDQKFGGALRLSTIAIATLRVGKTAVLKGAVTPPGSKSQAIRAIFSALLARGESVLHYLPDSDDVLTALDVCRQLGGQVRQVGDQWHIIGQGVPLPSCAKEINTGNSGLTTRLVMPILGLRQAAKQPIRLHCGDQMQKRPIQPLVSALRALGLTIASMETSEPWPMRLSGRLSGGDVLVSGVSSQYLSALLFSLPCVAQSSTIRVSHLNERPYVAMTLRCLQQSGFLYAHRYDREACEDIYTLPGGQQWSPLNQTMAVDFSSVGYLLAAAVLLPSQVVLQGITSDDGQGDQRLITILQTMGADIVVEAAQKQLIIRGGRPLCGCVIDAKDIPDLLPTLAVIATQASGKTVIRKAAHARMKETDRIHAMVEGLRRMGAKVAEHEDGLTVYQSTLHGVNNLKGYDDHRTVMAFALAGMLATGETVIEGARCVRKTFPQFVTMMQSLGAKMAMVAPCSKV